MPSHPSALKHSVRRAENALVDLVECRRCGHQRSEHSARGCHAQDVDLRSLAPAACACGGFETAPAAAEAPFGALDDEIGELDW